MLGLSGTVVLYPLSGTERIEKQPAVTPSGGQKSLLLFSSPEPMIPHTCSCWKSSCSSRVAIFATTSDASNLLMHSMCSSLTQRCSF